MCTVWIEEGIYDNNEARDFRNECAAHKEEILAAYETVYWDYSSEYPLPESVEDHVGASYIKKMREEFAEENDISDEEIDDEFQAYIDEATRIRRDETFHYKKGTTRSKATEIYDCDYTIID